MACIGFPLSAPTRILVLLAHAGLSICMTWTSECRGATVLQSARELPVAATVDVVVIGGTTAGVAAAESASQGHASVFLVAPRPYLGEDLCATLRLERPQGSAPLTRLGKRLFQEAVSTPGHVKATLAQILLDADVRFLLASYVTDILRDQEGRCCGVVIANRAGRQAIVAKTLIDATDRAWTARMAGCEVVAPDSRKVRFERVLLEPDDNSSQGFRRRMERVDIEMPDFSFSALMEAEQTARDQTHRPGLLGTSKRLFFIPPGHIAGRAADESRSARPQADVNRFCPRGEDGLYVLSGWADLTRAEAEALLEPAAMTDIAATVGKAVAAQAKSRRRPQGIHVPGDASSSSSSTEIRETLTGPRPTSGNLPIVPCEPTALPVLADVEVVVVGGGTAGAPAAIAAARRGLRTLVIEYQYGLGGVGTLGYIGRPYHGKKIGFSREVPFPGNVEDKMEWYRDEIRTAGGSIWLGTLGCGALVEGDLVRGVVVATPEGRGVVRAKVVIDATGNADVAVAAGADSMYGDIECDRIALQGTGLPVLKPGSYYVNSDYMLVDESDMVDTWRALVSVQVRERESYDVGTLIQTRERRRIVGDFVMRYLDQIAGRTYPDSVVFSGSDYDSHGYPSSPFFALLPHSDKSRKQNHPAPGGSCFTPYRCLLPRGLEGILVVGLGISMDRDATAMVRMQLDMANQGYAAGVAAAMGIRDDLPLRAIDIRTLQRCLVELGNLPAEVLKHEDSFPLSINEIPSAVVDFGRATDPGEAGRPLAILLTHPEDARPLLREAFARAEGRSRLLYAKVLAVLGDRDVVPTLLAALNQIEKWDSKILQGRMADYAHLPTPTDSIILALGYAGDRSAAPALVAMASRLDAAVTLSHHRAVAIALEKLASPTAAKPLAQLLQKPGMQGYAMTALPEGEAVEHRTESLREIVLARALLRCGDHGGVGRAILEQYTRDLRGLFARHARAVLKNAPHGVAKSDTCPPPTGGTRDRTRRQHQSP